MPTIEDLLQKINRLEEQLAQQIEKNNLMIEKADRAASFAQHAYRVDHYGYIWVWDVETKDYKKTNMRIVTPEVADLALQSRHIADNAIEGRHIQDDVIEGRMVKNKTIDGRSFKNNTIESYHIVDNSVHGDSFVGNALIPGKIADDAIWERNIHDRSVTAFKIGIEAILPEHFQRSTFWQLIKFYVENLQNQIDSLEVSGIALANVFGNDPHIGINQQRLTSAINQIWAVLEQITGNTYLGFTMVCDHDYFISETVETITLTATPSDPNGYFEHVAAYNGNTLIAEAENVNTFTCQAEITDTSTFRIVGKLLGVEYTRQHTVTHYNSFFLGAGTAYTDVLNVQHVIPIANNMRGAYDVTAADGDRLFVIVGDTLAEGFVRADMNGIEIAFTESTVTVSGKTYKVFTSGDTYQAGTYNIDING